MKTVLGAPESIARALDLNTDHPVGSTRRFADSSAVLLTEWRAC